MDQQQRTRRFSAVILLCACLLRLSLSGIPERLLMRLKNFSFPTYSETGRNVRFSASKAVFSDFLRESPAPWLPEPEKPVFSGEDAGAVELDNDSALQPDVAALLEQPLDWDLTEGGPAVLILHTHTTESYTKDDEDYRETSSYRTLEEEYNMVSIGDAVAEILTRAGIGVIHDRQVHDYPSYNGSYVHARASTEEILAQYPSIRLILDLHRDALEQEGKQLRPLAQVEGGNSAQLMLVVGTNVSRPSHESWEENLSLALKLHVQLERQSPGIMRPLNLRAQRFNQDLSPGALLVEVGAAGNTHREALTAARILAEGLVVLARGTKAGKCDLGNDR